MDNFFSLNSKFFCVMNKVGNMLFVSILFLIGCIPVVTIGVSVAAMYYTIVKVVRHENGYVSKEFIKAYKMNLKNGIIMTLLFLVLFVVLYIDKSYMSTVEGQSAAVMSFLYLLLNVIIMGILLYFFPILSRFTISKREAFRLATIMVFRHLPTTIMLLLLLIAGSCIVILIPIPMGFVMPGVVCFISSYFMEKVLYNYMAKPETKEDEEKWYYQ